MELIKSNLIIDKNYQPSIEQDYIEYFNRALLFTQTNYQERLERLAKLNFTKLSPTIFFEEYVWCVSCVGLNFKTVSKFFPTLSKELIPLYRSFSDIYNFPSENSFREASLKIFHNEDKINAILKCAHIMNNGIKLFGWEKYKDNFLNETNKLEALPFIGPINSKHLARNIGLSSDIMEGAHLNRLAVRWGFDSVNALCQDIQKRINLPLKVIGLILWYTAATFGTNISET